MAIKTYAQEAKTIMNKYKLRLGDKFDKSDPLALAAMNAELTTLQRKQEATRETELGAAPQFANGGRLPMHGGFDFSQFLNFFFITTNCKNDCWFILPFNYLIQCSSGCFRNVQKNY